MSGERLLILDGDSNAGRSILQSLGRRGYVCCLAATETSGSAFRSRYVAERAVYPDPLADKDAFNAWLLAFQRERRFALIIPATERTLVPLHELRGAPGSDLESVLAIPAAAALETAIDKEQVRALAASLGVPVPANILVHDPAELADPLIDTWLADTAVVVKSIKSKVWTGASAREFPAAILTTRADVERVARERLPWTPVQLQQWIPGRGVGIEVLVQRGKIVLSFAHERIHEYPLTGGGSPYRKAIAAPEALLRDTEKLVAALGWHGVAMAEFRVHEESGRYWLMEINPRFWGSLPLAIFAGADFPAALVDMLLHDRLPASSPAPRTGVYARFFSYDIGWTKALISSRGQDTRFLLTRPLGTSLLEWGRLFTGKETLDGGSFRDPLPILHEIGVTLQAQLEMVARKTRRAALLRSARRLSRARLGQLRGKKRILVLCYGNICRSPYAAERLKARTELRGTEVRSAGFHASVDRSTPPELQAVAARRGVDLAAHRSRLVDEEALAWADAVVLMDQKNFELLGERHPDALSKVIWLGAAAAGGGAEIDDPYGEDEETMGEILARLDVCVDGLVAALG
jgi:protein-tyrosine-phosphatase/predicted ATP-grasp superfamily ATP-dependent carboligase